MIGLFDILDQGIADELGVDVETYIEVIDMKASDEDADFIIMSILEGDEKNRDKAIKLFKSYMTEDSE
jgi:alpha-galactosidase/6-phospho-beta-glucosidase family protein